MVAINPTARETKASVDSPRRRSVNPVFIIARWAVIRRVIADKAAAWWRPLSTLNEEKVLVRLVAGPISGGENIRWMFFKTVRNVLL